MKPFWSGVFPAVTTQFKKDQSLDLPATARHIEALIESGVSGLILCGSLGENQTLEPAEKRAVLRCAVETARGRVPVLSGVAESSTAAAIRYVCDVGRLGASGVMLMPPMSYKGDPRESMVYFRAVARGGGLPIMIYNNPISYANDITPALFAELANEEKFVALKESSGDPRRITELHNTVGHRYAIFTGVDDLLLEASI
ncbi:MAG: dihydrodipicolinate synthase family protein, partial [Verrucomicrobia bacterium]|nr:dihydrodipicolinate synthase family protein [Verrucomicrobiota bacterium]